MSRFLLPATLGTALGLVLVVPTAPAAPPAAPGKPEDELVEKVRKGIDKGVAFLKSQRNGQGNWEGLVLTYLADMDGGTTALVTLALLNCGVKPEDPSIARALEYLHGLPPRKTYVVALQNLVFLETRKEKYKPRIQENADWLINNAINRTRGRDGWSYPGNSVADNSNTQYALLGLYAAKQAGAKIDDDVWKGIQEYYNRHQRKPAPTLGYWTYHNANFGGGDEPSFSMTVAGVCGLIIAGMGLDQSEQQLDETTGVAKNCGLYSENTGVARGMNWIAAKFSFESPKSTFYNVYGLERLGRLSGQRWVGKYDWYREGCEFLLGKGREAGLQNENGSISKGKGIDGAEVLTTAFALLFLSKGRTPVLVSKFAWGRFQDRGNGTFVEVDGPAEGSANWNRKHNDTRHVVEFASRELFKNTPLSWQVYDVRRQTNISTQEKILEEVGILLESPVLYINGHGQIILTDVQREILKKYVEEGGFILAEACCGDPAFTKSFRALMKELFPNNDLRKLPPEHAIWRADALINPADFPDLEGMEKGCRTVMVFSPKPLAGYWEEHRFMPEPGKPAKNQGEKAFRLAGNVIAYATGLELPKPKLSRRVVYDGKGDAGAPRSYLKAVQLNTIGSDSEPAPAAMRNLMGYLKTNARLDVVLDKETMDPGDQRLFGFKFMYLHGRKPINLTEDGVEQIKSNLQTGGILFADAACNGMSAWKEFDKSFRATVKKLFPESELVPIPPDDPLFSAKNNGGTPLTQVRCRREKPDGTGPEAELRTYAPILEGVKVDGRWVIVYSKYDVGCALEGHKSSDCLGHDKDSALRIGAAVVLYFLKR
jgi:hypothetical protein